MTELTPVPLDGDAAKEIKRSVEELLKGEWGNSHFGEFVRLMINLLGGRTREGKVKTHDSEVDIRETGSSVIVDHCNQIGFQLYLYEGVTDESVTGHRRYTISAAPDWLAIQSDGKEQEVVDSLGQDWVTDHLIMHVDEDNLTGEIYHYFAISFPANSEAPRIKSPLRPKGITLKEIFEERPRKVNPQEAQTICQEIFNVYNKNGNGNVSIVPFEPPDRFPT